MRKFYVFLLILFLLTVYIFPKQIKASIDVVDAWQIETNSLPYLLANHVSFGFINKLFVITGSAVTYHGHNETISSTPDLLGNLSLWNYDTPYYKPMIWAARASTFNYIYILGGLEEYDTPSITRFSNNYVYFAQNTSPLIWTPTTFLPTRLSKGAAVIAGNYIYFSGGWTDNENNTYASKTVYYALLDGDGKINIEGWKTTTDLPEKLWGHGMVEGGNYLFVIGGTNDSGEKSAVYKAKINADGTLGIWTAAPGLPTPERNFAYTKVGNYIFIAGGKSPSAFLNKVIYTSIDEAGNMAAWQESANTLITPNHSGSLAALGEYLYLTGGVTAPGAYTNKVYRAKLNLPTPTSTAGPTATPTTEPTASPTASPTPSPTPISLPNLTVPDIKQFWMPWNDDIYNHTAGTIEQFGCALTSASMVLKYHGHSYANPDTLNNWLKTQTDGYISNGLVNWLAISRYSREHSSASSRTLEYRRLSGNNSLLINELENNRPAILKVPNHFIVAKSQLPATFGINDPGYYSRITLGPYGDTFLAINSFRPTSTDLSYLMFIVNPSVILRVFDSNGNEVGQNYLDEPLIDDSGGPTQSGNLLNIYLVEAPSFGSFTLEADTGNNPYLLQIYTYDRQGNLLNGIDNINETGPSVINLNYDNNSETPSTDKNIDSLIAELDLLRKKGWIDNYFVYLGLKNKLLTAKIFESFLQKKVFNNMLRAFLNQLEAQKGKHVNPSAYQILREDCLLIMR